MVKINIDKLLVKFWIISIFFDSYSFFFINDYHITMFTFVTIISIIYGLVKMIKGKGVIVRSSFLTASFLMLIHIVISTLMTGCRNITSPLRISFNFVALILSARVEDKEDIHEYIYFFQKLMNIMAVYGIYQFFARMYMLPFSDIIIKGHMVPGFNWSNIETFWGSNAYRSNAIFLEPSFFSQFLAINILLYSAEIYMGYKNKKSIITIIINIIAMIFTFAGTGLVLLFFGILFFILSQLSVKQKAKRIWMFIVVFVVAFLMLLPFLSQTEMWKNSVEFIVKRISELTGQNQNARSGWIRFVSGFIITISIWKQNVLNFLFGGGMGSATYYTNLYSPSGALDNSAIYRVAGELGFIGIVIYFYFLGQVFKNSKGNIYMYIIASSVIAMTVCGEAFTLNYSWVLLYILNCMEPSNDKSNLEKLYEI